MTAIPHLYCRKGYFSWRDPRTGIEHGLGRDEADARAQAAEANVLLEHLGSSLADRLKAPRPAKQIITERTIATFIPRYRELLDARELAPKTRAQYKSTLAAIEGALGSVKIEAGQEALAAVTHRASLFLRTYEEAGKRQTAKKLKGTLVDMFAAAAREGWVSVNPINVIDTARVTVKRQRLTLDDYLAIHKAAGGLYPWVQRSMELGLVSLQRREDVANMRFSHIKDGRIAVVQHKTGTRLRIPLALRLEAVSLSLSDVLGLCRDAVVSRALVHHSRRQGRATVGEPVGLKTISAAFTEARELAGITIEPGKTPPTFHELRSLGTRLYTEQGYQPQALLGHKDAKTTALYQDNRGAEWIDVAA